ncbi:DUF2380 domain-containing protein [Grimontia sp. AD028]|uniref:DUF2380 domain-containing protein n=1 Tax=Grimontia sp. AD028 TaxID=1581149 RepID=UPI001E415F53|nr:DUF2380 domain-containing protein [Grimontia sp. AD028]
MMTMINPNTGSLAARFFTALSITALLFSVSVCASGRLAVLDFELSDLTQVDDNSKEVERTASLAPMLRDALANTHGYTSVAIPSEAYKNANQGFGYLFDHADATAQLGQAIEADWVVISRLHKPSFLFSYLISQIVNVKTGLAYPELIVEIKGQQEEMNRRGIDKMAGKIARQIGAMSKPTVDKD